MPHAVQAAWPASEKVCAAQDAHTVLLVAVQVPPLATAEPAAQLEQGAQGELPLALQVLPATQGAMARHERDGTSQKKPAAHVQLDRPASVPFT